MGNPQKLSNNSESLKLAFESLDSCEGYINHISYQVHDLLKLYKQEHNDLANVRFFEVTDLLGLYVQLMTRIYRVFRLEIKNCPEKNKSILAKEIHLIATIKAIHETHEKNDLIALCDLLEHELLANLNEWKTSALPELKKLKNY